MLMQLPNKIIKFFKLFQIPRQTSLGSALVSLVQISYKASQYYHTNYFKTFLRGIHLMKKKYFLPEVAFKFGLFNPKLSAQALSQYVSRKQFKLFLLSLNPESLEPLLEDKSIFYLYCVASEIPIPKLYALFFKESLGWSNNGLSLRNQDEWQRFFRDHLPQEFVIKPARGVYGDQVLPLTRSKDKFIDPFGKSYKPEQIYLYLSTNQKYDSFIIQERLKNHSDLIRLSDTQSLQTVRVCTFIDKRGAFQIVHSHFRIITKQNVIDNFKLGETGNLEAWVNVNTGVLDPAIEMRHKGCGMQRVDAHPKTGVFFKGFELPMWTEICKLTETIAFKFLPIRTIGWDIAMTPNGPFVLEGNIWYDPCNQLSCMDKVMDALTRN